MRVATSSPIARSAASPAAWPKESLMALKWSTSKTTSASGAVRALGAGQLGVEALLEGAAVERAGQRVVAGERAQPDDQREHLLAEHDDHERREARGSRRPP